MTEKTEHPNSEPFPADVRIRDALTGLYNLTDDPRLLGAIQNVITTVTAILASPASMTKTSTPAAQGTASGWKLMPERMTADMINAWSGGLTVSSDEIAYRTNFQAAWARMLSASPPPPTEALPASGVVWFGFDESTGEFTGEYSTVNPHDALGMVSFVRAALSPTEAPAPATGGEVRVKPLDWQPTSSGFCWHAASAVGRYFIEERHNDFRWNVEGWPGAWAVNTLDTAKAAAQADYEARIRASLASDASPSGATIPAASNPQSACAGEEAGQSAGEAVRCCGTSPALATTPAKGARHDD